MTALLTDLFCYPIKGLGREALDMVDLQAGAPMPGDRAWAVLHKGAEADTDAWQPRRNFLVVANAPRFAQVTAERHGDGRITLSHPDAAAITADPSTDGPAIVAWATAIWPEERPAPHRLVQSPSQGMADNGEAEVSILNRASLAQLSERLGQDLDIARFRGNLIVDDLSPWAEFDLVGRTLKIGEATLEVTGRIERCRATDANPHTGTRDTNMLGALRDGWGHQDFGIYARISEGGTVRVGDPVTA